MNRNSWQSFIYSMYTKYSAHSDCDDTIRSPFFGSPIRLFLEPISAYRQSRIRIATLFKYATKQLMANMPTNCTNDAVIGKVKDLFSMVCAVCGSVEAGLCSHFMADTLKYRSSEGESVVRLPVSTFEFRCAMPVRVCVFVCVTNLFFTLSFAF